MGKRRIIWFLIGFLVLIVGVFSGSISARASDLSGETSGLDAGSPKITRSDNLVVANDSVLEEGQKYKVVYSWKVNDGVPITAGDWATITLPSAVPAFDQQMDTDIVLSGSKEIAGHLTFSANSRTGIITFNDKLQGTDIDRSGTISFWVVGEDSSTGSHTETTGTPSGGSDTGGGTGSHSSDDGSGSYVFNKVGWPGDKSSEDGAPVVTSLVWNIVFNGQGQDYGDTTVTDELGPYQTYIPGSVVLNDYCKDAVYTVESNADGTQITFKFSNVHSPIGFTFKAGLKPYASAGYGEYYNDAYLKTDNFADLTPSHVSGMATWGMQGNVGGDTYQGSVSFLKLSLGSKLALANAVYGLYRADGTYMLDRKTGADGTFSLRGLKTGKYYFSERVAPDGYLTNSDSVPFSISPSDSGQVVSVSQYDVSESRSSTSISSIPSASSSVPTSSIPSESSSTSASSTPSGSSSDSTSSLPSESSSTSTSSIPSASSSVPTSSIPSGSSSLSMSSRPSGGSETSSSTGNVSDSSVTLSSSDDSGRRSGTTSSNHEKTSLGRPSGSESVTVVGTGQDTPTSSTPKTTRERTHGTSAGIVATVTPGHHQKKAGFISQLPQTNEQKAVAGLFLGLLLLGGTLSYLQWRRNRS
ncbi:prealbumin-like fold domain-containing protein [Levilactobacillus namurensis]|uniref:prealbumin-like fold domain-containing protein n=1 Tax=Levilactobacillus namurensis TaxID=380393 RepID=UPI0004B86EB2|nr:prealbumin-like fold domain-containing protein [Levilactobacillus namurensis]